MKTLTTLLLLSLPFLHPSAVRASESIEGRRGYELLQGLMSENGKQRRNAAEALLGAGDRRWVVPLVDTYFFIPGARRTEALEVLEGLTGASPGSRYLDWVGWVGGSDLEPPELYAQWKTELLAQIDERYRQVFHDGATVKIRLEEIVWGGVPLEGIPSVDHPEQLPAQRARYLEDSDRVFGVALGGEARAYPVKILSWHEMLNDVVGGEPVALSYCTLCGSGILYSTRTAGGEARSLGTSGLLYRSNKLMVDRDSLSLWSNLTGEAVVGREAASGSRLEMLPLTLTTWKAWREEHPDTTVMKPDRGAERRYGFRYREGAADERREGVSFPVWQRSALLDDKAEIFALRLDGRSKAYPLDRLDPGTLIEDRLGQTDLLLIVDRAGAVRAYDRGELRFVELGEDEVVDSEGRSWQITEEGLTPPPESALAPRARLAGHVAFWFGWYGFYPDTEVWGVDR